MNTKIKQVISLIDYSSISENRKSQLKILIEFINEKRKKNAPVQLNFICTHNSRRSQFAQVWAKVAAYEHKISIDSYSGGVEVTACNPRTVSSLERFGFDINATREENSKYVVRFSSDEEPLILFSKLFDDATNPTSEFAAVMTCSHADENCPLVAGCESRISLPYEDPKFYDDSPLESVMYDCRSFQIATEMMYIFSKIN